MEKKKKRKMQLDSKNVQEAGAQDPWKWNFVGNMCLVVMINTYPAVHRPSDSMLSINNTGAVGLSMHHFQTDSSHLPGAIQALNPPPELSKWFFHAKLWSILEGWI